jgi:RNA polymerase sigma factor (sigma-70 family)
MVSASKDPTVDEGLVVSARQGNRAAFAELAARHRPLLMSLCEHSLGDPGLADDAAQEALLQALLALESLRQPAQFGPWLGGIGLNVCRRWLRARGRATLSLDNLLGGQRVREPVDTLAVDPAWAAEEFELATRVRQAVHALPPGQRSAVTLFYLNGLTHTETAAALGIPVGAVKTRLHKARANLRHDLWKLWEEMQPMSTKTIVETTSDYVDVRVWDVRRVLPNEKWTIARNVVLLQETGDRQRILGVWMGAFESEAILILLSGVQVPRPLTFTFAVRLLRAAGGEVQEVRINRLEGSTYFAEALIRTPDGNAQAVDSRPSDAIALALATGAPVRVAEAVMRETGEMPSQLESRLTVDGQRVLGKLEISQEMERIRAQRDAELEEATATLRDRRVTGGSAV